MQDQSHMQRAKLRVQQAVQCAEVSRAESVLCHVTLSVNKAASPHCWLQLLKKENTYVTCLHAKLFGKFKLEHGRLGWSRNVGYVVNLSGVYSRVIWLDWLRIRPGVN